MTRATALPAEVEPLRRDASSAATAFDVAEDDPTIAGHYPGFPVLPGVYLIDALDSTVRHWAGPGADIEMTAMDRCRFHRPVFPGDRLFVEAAVSDTAEGLMVKGAIVSNRGKVADIRLRYRTSEEPGKGSR
jgi:3-hydroxyacyl-[acyl-carrier-protein] dehydratase